MRALVVYESMYGNTHVVASNIADGLRATHEVTLVPVAGATADLVAGADLLVVGGPTHMHGLSSSASRRMAAEAAAKPASGLSLDPDACGPGLRDWLKEHRRRARPGGRLRHPAQRRRGVHRPRQPGHRQDGEAARLPSHRRPGELPGRPAEHAARRRDLPGPPLGCRPRRHRDQHPRPGTGLSVKRTLGLKTLAGSSSGLHGRGHGEPCPGSARRCWRSLERPASRDGCPHCGTSSMPPTAAGCLCSPTWHSSRHTIRCPPTPTSWSGAATGYPRRYGRGAAPAGWWRECW